jgi:hypothetical protein
MGVQSQWAIGHRPSLFRRARVAQLPRREGHPHRRRFQLWVADCGRDGSRPSIRESERSEFYGSGADADLFGTGISPSLVGDFYSEGGLIAIIIFSILYGYALAKLMGLSTQYTSSQSGLIQGIIVASLFPILRGGDLPGIVAFIAMAYWPLFIFLFLYRRAIKKQIYYTKLEV